MSTALAAKQSFDQWPSVPTGGTHAAAELPLRKLASTRQESIDSTKIQGIEVQSDKPSWKPTEARDELLTPSQVVAEWHGQVISIGEECFVAELKGTIGNGVAGNVEEAQIPINEVRPDDIPLLQPGAFFRLCVNVEFRNRTRRRFTDLVFRRMPAYRREELEQARQEAIDLVRGLRLE